MQLPLPAGTFLSLIGPCPHQPASQPTKQPASQPPTHPRTASPAPWPAAGRSPCPPSAGQHRKKRGRQYRGNMKGTKKTYTWRAAQPGEPSTLQQVQPSPAQPWWRTLLVNCAPHCCLRRVSTPFSWSSLAAGGKGKRGSGQQGNRSEGTEGSRHVHKHPDSARHGLAGWLLLAGAHRWCCAGGGVPASCGRTR